MKILFLNPHVDAEHKVVQALQAKGHGVLLPMDSSEADQMLQLHGKSVELAVIHREGIRAVDDGVHLLNQIKADSAQADLPVILSSSEWGDAEFAVHQDSPAGAHAYLKWPFDESALLDLMASMFEEAPASEQEPSIQPPGPPLLPPPPPEGAALVLEDATGIFTTAKNPGAPIEFSLDAPEFIAEQSASMDPISLSVPQESPESLAMAAIELSPSSELSQPSESQAVDFEKTSITQDVPLSVMDPSAEGGLEKTGLLIQDQAAPAEVAIDAEPSLSAVNIEGFGDLSPPAVPIEAEHSESPKKSTESNETNEKFNEEFNEEDLADEMPYLFSRKKQKADQLGGTPTGVPSALVFAQPVGDAVVPGGAAQSPDTETLKKYLMLREQDVAVLSTQLRTTQDQVGSLEAAIRSERTNSLELQRTIEDQNRKIEEFEKDKAAAVQTLQSEITELRFQIKSKSDKARVLELQVREAGEEIERVKDRVRSDIRKIRVREKELENRLEIMKKDSEALIAAREVKIIELKRKIDILEFNMDLLQDQYSREKDSTVQLRERLARAAQVVRAAGGILDTQGGLADLVPEDERGTKAS